jgi:CheY-like chemotaxis protein
MKKILIVEDDYTISFFTKSVLSSMGFSQVISVTSGEEAVIIVESFKPDLILMDILLEGKLDGIETAAIIQKKNIIPVIYLTANSDVETFDKAQATDCRGFIKKPFMPAELASCIKKVFG